MLIKEIQLININIPFQQAFRHSSADRSQTQSVWIKVNDDNDQVGYGESCPREYVTGESVESVKEFFVCFEKNIKNTIQDLSTLENWQESHSDEIDKNPAAWCAIELAILDLLGKQQKCSVEKMLGIDELSRRFQYTAVLGDNEVEKFKKQLDKYLSIGFKDLKIKLSGDYKKDFDKFELFKNNSEDSLKVRVDANNLWSTGLEAIEYLKSLNYPFIAIEEPLGVNNYEESAHIADALSTKIILDESLLNKHQFSFLSNNINAWIINLRISKMGGLIRSKAIIDQARELGIEIIVGAQVGETSLLTRAALAIVQYAGDICIAQEGAFGTLLLKYDIIDFPLMFNEGGRLDFEKSLDKAVCGFQLNINDSGFSRNDFH